MTATMTRSASSPAASGAAESGKQPIECACDLRRHIFDNSESMSDRRVSQLQQCAANNGRHDEKKNLVSSVWGDRIGVRGWTGGTTTAGQSAAGEKFICENRDGDRLYPAGSAGSNGDGRNGG